MKKSQLILTMCSFLFSLSSLFGQINISVSQQNTGIKTSEKTVNGYGFRSDIKDISLTPAATNSGLFYDISVEHYSRSYDIGKPQLPNIRKTIQLPIDGQANVIINSFDVVEISLSDYGITQKIMPSQPSYSKSSDPEDIVFQYNQAYYLLNQYTNTPLAEIEEIGISRGVKLGNLIINPIQYNPVSNSLKIYTNIDVKIQFSQHDIYATQALQQKLYSPAFSNNSSTAEMLPLGINKEALSKYPIKYVIVSDPSFQSALQPLVEWKTKKGFYVIEAYTNNPAVGTTTTSIKNYLQNLYTSATPSDPAPTYVLFVGDIAQIPAYSGTTDSHVSDLYYVTFDGASDNIPDMYYGRFSATNLAQLQPQIDKTLQYEQYLMPDPSYLDTVVLVAGVDPSWSPTHANGQINYMANYYFNADNGFAHVYKYLYPETNNSSTDVLIRTNIGKGVGIADYTAHCNWNGWGDPSFTTSHIPAMSNKDKYGLLIGNCCLSNKFDESECFGEALLRAVDKGAVGYLGGSNNTYWDEDYYWSVGLRTIISANATFDPNNLGAFDRWFHTQGIPETEWYISNGQLSYAGNLAVESSNSSRKKYYWEIYHLMGDPSVMTYQSVPSVLSVDYVNTQTVGITSLTVTTEPGAYVAISLNDTLLNAKLANTSGIAEMTFAAILSPDTADIVVTKQNRQPFFGEVYILSPSLPNDVSITEISNPENTYNCSNIEIIPEISIKNMGTNNLTSLTAYYQWNNNTPISTPWTGNLESLESTEIQFPAITLPLGNHTIKTWTSTPNNQVDENHANDTLIKEVTVLDLSVTADFEANNTYSCLPPLNVQFHNLSENASSYIWDFGDGSSSTEENPIHTYQNNGTYQVHLIADADICGQEEIIKESFIQIGLESPAVEDITLCNPESVELTATGNGIIKWYDAIDSENEIFIGNTFITPMLTETTTYYVQSFLENNPDTVGDSRTNSTGSYFSSSYVHGLYITNLSAGKIKSAVFNSNANKTRIFKLVNMQGETIEEVSVSIPTGINRIDMNMNIPIGKYKLLGPVSANLYRNTSNSSYPYEIDGVFSIDSSTAGTSSLGYYYYFYDIIFQENDCSSEKVPVNVSINENYPANAVEISGVATPCFGSIQTYSTPPIANASSYQWILPVGMNAIGNITHNTIQVSISNEITNGVIQVRGTNGCGLGDSTTLTINSLPLPAAAGNINGQTTVCTETNNITYSINNVLNAEEYIWNLPNGFTFVGAENGNSITINIGATALSDTIKVTPINTCGQGQSQSIFINVLSIPQLTSFSEETTSICPGETQVEYSIDGTWSNTNFQWNLPTNATGTSTTNSILVDFNTDFIGGTISVSASNTCGTSNLLETELMILEEVAPAGVITGETEVCQGTANITYTIPDIPHASEYIWTLPLGIEGISTSNSITVEYTLAAASGNITVYGKNNCYQGEEASLALEVLDLPYVPCTLTGFLEVCQNETNVEYSILPIPNATSYEWTIPNGAIGSSTSNIIQIDFSNAISGGVTVRGVNDCGFGPIIDMNVVVKPLPQASFTHNVTNHTVDFNNTSQNASSYKWLFGDGNIATIQNPSHTYANDDTYNVTLIANNACSSDTTNKEIVINTQSVSEYKNNKYIEVYPNPSADGKFNIVISSHETANKSILVSNLLGQMVYQMESSIQTGINTLQIDLSTLSKGMYYLIIDHEVLKISLK
ncbi:MAG: C25 family cysteine peptidase [Bacteroidales bacterium]|nr:C25 family cysteine peptidase [Bacteroidales bacterium]